MVRTLEGKMGETDKEKINTALEILKMSNTSFELASAAEEVLMEFLKSE